jgi:hypothetical protein
MTHSITMKVDYSQIYSHLISKIYNISCELRDNRHNPDHIYKQVVELRKLTDKTPHKLMEEICRTHQE